MVCAAAGTGGAHGQQQAERAEQEISPTLAAARALGMKAEGVRRALAVAPMVVICPDEVSYLDALRQWSPQRRFPVLIDDGSHDAAADIARFVRAFEPERVLWFDAMAGGSRGDTADEARAAARRHDSPDVAARAATADNPAGADAEPGEAAGSEGAESEDAEAAPSLGPADFRARAEAIVARAWGVRPRDDTTAEPGMKQALLAWEAFDLHPFGVVACDARHGCRVAAVALAAGRAQPIVWVETPAGVNRAMTPDEARAISDAITSALDELGMQWNGLGAGIDAITLCAEAPVRIEGGPETLAATDAIGRDPDDPMQRWAWTGQIFGSPPEAAYRAMCSLFLRPGSAWLFDGYPNEGPWMQYDQSAAAAVLRQAKLEVTIDDNARGSLDSWRSRTGLGVDADLIFVNSKGNKARFNLVGGTGHAADVPFLQRPAAVYFIHSWSATQPRARGTVAGKWLARGAYAYVGSVSEPYLQSFVPPVNVAARLGAGLPLAAAARPDESPPWKLAMIGDPLITFGSRPPAAEVEPDLPGAAPLEERMRSRLSADPPDFAAAVRTLSMLGRDGDAAKLVAATLRERPQAVDAGVADVAVIPLLAVRDRETLALVARLTSHDRRADALDALWHLGWRHLRATSDANLAATMAANIRDHMLGRDAEDVANALQRARGRAAATNFLHSMRQRATREPDQQQIDKLIEQVSRQP
jgi:hypothetical protein